MTNKNTGKQSKEIRIREHWCEYMLSLTLYLVKQRISLYLWLCTWSTFCSYTWEIYKTYKLKQSKN